MKSTAFATLVMVGLVVWIGVAAVPNAVLNGLSRSSELLAAADVGSSSMESHDCTSGTMVTDALGRVWTLRTRDERVMVDGQGWTNGYGTEYLYKDGVVHVLGQNGHWYAWSNGEGWMDVGAPGKIASNLWST
jgi:hypothetical protein